MRKLDLKVPPLALMLIVGALMWLLAHDKGAITLGTSASTLLRLAILFCGSGIACCVSGIFAFRQSQTTVDPRQPAASRTIVQSGIYRFSRNPMYLGFLLILIGWASYLNDGRVFIFLPLFVIYLTQFQIKPEERALLTKFGVEYANYLHRVRRWV